ncbi:MAG: diaminopimelate epimerase [Lachnospiraceae bacterium]|nr:diaminopimelate epimerase [Lachnospiraceae bacterium]
MHFTKMHGIGNDYIYVDTRHGRPADPGTCARLLSDRHFGIGSDGLILINPSGKADFEMEMYNADGSRGKMCGNGIRCVGKYVYDHGLTDRTTITVDTLAGVRTLTMKKGSDGKIASVRVDMGQPSLDPGDLPMDLSVLGPYEENRAGSLADTGTVLNYPLEVNGRTFHITCVSMGNPHCVIFMEEDIGSLRIEEVGTLFENNPLFPEGVNTEFVNCLSKDRIRMRVWERGSGETLACGTGACAAAYAAMCLGFTEHFTTVELLGGTLGISLDGESGHLYMEGPAEEVFTGDVPVEMT